MRPSYESIYVLSHARLHVPFHLVSSGVAIARVCRVAVGDLLGRATKFYEHMESLMISIKGRFRVQSVYVGENAAYLSLKDKSDGALTKISVDLPLPKAVVDDGLIELDGPLASRLFQNNVSLTYTGVITAVPEK
jgi:hypothetical protein